MWYPMRLPIKVHQSRKCDRERLQTRTVKFLNGDRTLLVRPAISRFTKAIVPWLLLLRGGSRVNFAIAPIPAQLPDKVRWWKITGNYLPHWEDERTP